MAMRRVPALLGVILWMAGTAAGWAQDAATPQIALSGPGIAAATLTRESLTGLPQVEMDVTFQTSKGESKGRYKGVLLWDVLIKAGLGKSGDRHALLRSTFVAMGRDGYAVAFSIGEIAPDFGDRPVMVAMERDGAALLQEKGLRLIVPGDRRGARSVRDVVRIERR